jgi:hypothetical protein
MDGLVDESSQGKSAASINSEPIFEKQEAPIPVVVDHNCEAIVMDADKDVLVQFYPPGHVAR